MVNKFSDGNIITNYLATAYAEGFETPPSSKDILLSWAYLIGTGLCWKLQGWFGRNARNLIDNGVISKKCNVLISENELFI